VRRLMPAAMGFEGVGGVFVGSSHRRSRRRVVRWFRVGPRGSLGDGSRAWSLLSDNLQLCVLFIPFYPQAVASSQSGGLNFTVNVCPILDIDRGQYRCSSISQPVKGGLVIYLPLAHLNLDVAGSRQCSVPGCGL